MEPQREEKSAAVWGRRGWGSVEPAVEGVRELGCERSEVRGER